MKPLTITAALAGVATLATLFTAAVFITSLFNRDDVPATRGHQDATRTGSNRATRSESRPVSWGQA